MKKLAQRKETWKTPSTRQARRGFSGYSCGAYVAFLFSTESGRLSIRVKLREEGTVYD